MMTSWPWLAVEVSRYVHLAYSVFIVFILAHAITIIIFSCSRKKEVKKFLMSDKETGSLSCRAPKNQNQPQQQQQQPNPPQNDKISVNEKEKVVATTQLSSAKPG
uniref:Uncharacterized protein n=1 Tax=Panagrolaimus sp. ES5 TaxID=591445 RepID=A0AC34FY63_9BILA